MKKIRIIALAAHGKGISGGDRLATEFARHWSKLFIVEVITWEEGAKMFQRQGLFKTHNLVITKVKHGKIFRQGFFSSYFFRIIWGFWWALNARIKQPTIIYSASEFWMDSLPGLILKLRNKRHIWVPTWYQTAPNPLAGFSRGKRENRYYFKAWLYWLVQLPIKPLIARYGDFVLVNNEIEKKQFPTLDKKKKVIVVLGGVDTKGIINYRIDIRNKKIIKKYDAVFQGRFHPQKGVVELVKIWGEVVQAIPNAKLIMIGDGPLMENVQRKVKSEKLENNIVLKGYLFDGDDKFRIFAESKIVVHPAFFDSGGMASAEAMVFGLPAIGFDLAAYKSYYPKGMVKVSVGDLNKFSDEIIYLLKNQIVRLKVGKEGQDEIMKNWSWEKRAKEVLNLILVV